MKRQRTVKWPAFRLRLTRFQAWLLILATFLVGGVVAGAIVFTRGLVVTNLTDLVPWGLWITLDLSSIALSAGAFLLCAAVYLLGLKQFQPLARTATFIGLIGYSMAVLCLLLDIGRPERFWHALVFWNPHSVLWEVTMCVTLYLAVLSLETLPILGQTEWLRRRWPKLASLLNRVHHLAPYLAIVGLGLSLLHQSSLGATYGVLKARPIWYRPDLSVLFIVSAMAAGPALTVLASMVAGRVTRRAQVDDHMLERVAHAIGWVLVGYLYFRFWDAFAMTYTYEPGRTEGLSLLTQGPLSFNFWIGEMLLGAVIPIVILLNPRLRRRPLLRMLALALIVGGVVAYRWDTNLAGQLVILTYLPQEITARYTTYFPSLIEILSGAGIVAYGLLAFTIGVRHFNVVDHRAAAEHDEVQSNTEPALAAAD
ncbi:MAG TPA: NrfD/PsrC family molybdoenzyme membrane anchor subunit [Anaerolineae bacterium]|nr:NrfD/PsrC family molybdoenzyme membrane anchor subunit [Anaerolineae bacterium]